jgi:hypothetical protein
MTDDGVRAAARAVRQFLPELVGPEAGRLDAEVAGLLAEPGSTDRLRRLLDEREGTRAFLGAVLDDAPRYRPPQARPENTKDASGYSPLPGRIGPLAPPRFRCPDGDDYDWWQLSRTDPIPVCDTHGCRLVPVRG